MENYYILEIKDFEEDICFGLLVFDDYNELLKAKSLIEKSECDMIEDLYSLLTENGYDKNWGAIFKVEI